ncbi:MAG: hypothetical protein KAS62_05610, partial [Candidatus Delongbacteria bacterium]|nr:hypothetical protein [Candidatus Delongbacteria bacterium]
NENVGGLVGDNFGHIANSYSSANVTGNNYVAGLTGYSNGSYENCYSTGYVDGVQNVGGLTGLPPISSVSCYWDIETSGQPTSTSGSGKTSAEMKQMFTYENWDFEFMDSLWTIDQYKNDGYPYLSWQNNISINPPSNITTNISGGYFEMNWDEVPNAIAYKVYVCDEPYGTYILVSQEPINSYGYSYDDKMKFFYIVAVFSE